MFTYTKRELKLLALALSLTLLILLLYNLVIYPIINPFFSPIENKIYSDYVYSKIIPIEEIKTLIENTELLPTTYINSSEENTDINCVSALIYKQSENKISEESIDENNAENLVIEENIIQSNANTENQIDVIEQNKNITWRIQIPKINLDVHIIEGTSSDILLKAVGHFEETSKWQGNVGLAAHNRGYQCNFFAKIKNLKIGDEIIYTTTNGKKVYKIETNKVIQDTDWSYLQETEDNRITLITCEENRENYRRCIQAVEIASYKI